MQQKKARLSAIADAAIAHNPAAFTKDWGSIIQDDRTEPRHFGDHSIDTIDSGDGKTLMITSAGGCMEVDTADLAKVGQAYIDEISKSS